jgi:hypothetical protein
MATNNKKGTGIVLNPNSIAARIKGGLRKLNESDLSSGLTKMTSGRWYYAGSGGTDIDGRGVGLATFTDDKQSKLVACGGSRFATLALGVVGRSEQKKALEDAALLGSAWDITVTGEGADKQHTFVKA